MNGDSRSTPWRWVAAVFVVTLAAQLGLVAVAGTDVPFFDQWGAEGARLYPAIRTGQLHLADVFAPHNEHRIVWTHLLNLLLFAIDGQWDPLVQLVAGALLRAGALAVIVATVLQDTEPRWRAAVSAVSAFAFLPQLAWHNAVWGFQTQVYFAVLFSVLAFRRLVHAERTFDLVVGLGCGVAGLLAMAPTALVPVALLAVVGLRLIERRRLGPADARLAAAATALLALALVLRVDAPQHASLHAHGLDEFGRTLLVVLGWPHVDQPLAAIVLNLPIALAIATRMLKMRTAHRGEDFVLLLGMWSALLAVAAAWARGGSDEFLGAVPSRYVDFVMLLPLANLWLLVVIAGWVARERRRIVLACAAAWCGFLLLGWAGLSAEMVRRIILPRAADRDAPVRLMAAFQRTGDPAVFAGQPRLLVPNPTLDVVARVLHDPRMAGALPPSLQPERPLGPLSRCVRVVLRR